MKAKIDEIVITLNDEEARILWAVLRNIGGTDPYGDASEELGLHINTTVKVGTNLEKILEKICHD